MSKNYRFFLLAVGLMGLGLVTALFINIRHADVLNPAGQIAQKQFDLMVFAILLMLVIIIPVFVMTFVIVRKYREGNAKKTKYLPNWDGSRLYESIWWGFPLVIIIILSIVTWQSSHELDPFKPIKSDTKPMTIQVVALQWKWLFIYPEENIATVNYVQFPEKTPVTFKVTSDGPMNSFWIPRLGGQMYAMSGMSSELNLMADKTGTYRGSSANISGEGFAGMKFNAQSTHLNDFNRWVDHLKLSPDHLDESEFNQLAEPSQNNPKTYYSSVEDDLYNKITMKYMAPADTSKHPDHMYTGEH